MDNRTVVQILFSRRKPVEGFPHLSGMQAITYPAKRNKGTGYLSAMLCKAVVVAISGSIKEIAVLESPGILRIKSISQSKGLLMKCWWTEEAMWLPFGAVTYHLGLLLLAEALTKKEEAADLLDALQELLEYQEREKPKEGDRRFVELVAHATDELWYWAAYENRSPDTSNRLESLKVLDSNEEAFHRTTTTLDPNLFVNAKVLSSFRFGEETQKVVEPEIIALPNTRFRGWQLLELVEDLTLGFHCLLVGPTSTGKSLSAYEGFKLADPNRQVFVIEGHESMKEFDLLGGYVPDGQNKFVWKDGVLVAAMRAGGFLLIDEANRMPTRTLNILLGVLSRNAVVLTEHGSEEVIAQPGFQVVMAMNLGSGYAVNQLDAALLNRFPITLEYRYLPYQEEVELLTAETNIERRTAEVMVKVAQETRAKKKNHELGGEITPRHLIAWAEKVKGKDGDLIARLQHAAKVTWMHSVAGVDSNGYVNDDKVAELYILIESHTPRGAK